MWLIYFLTMVIQPIILPTPEALTVMGGLSKLGATQTFFLGLVGVLIGITLVYFISRSFGERLIGKVIKEKDFERFSNFIKKNETIFIGILFILPILPDEVVCVGAGILSIRFVNFIAIAFISKVISIGSIAFSYELGEVFNIDSTNIFLLQLLVMGICILLAKVLSGKNNKEIV